jgi:hypothetical protein
MAVMKNKQCLVMAPYETADKSVKYRIGLRTMKTSFLETFRSAQRISIKNCGFFGLVLAV